MAKYVAAYLSRVYGLCRVWCVIFNRNIVHLLVLINKFIQNARYNYQTLGSVFWEGLRMTY